MPFPPSDRVIYSKNPLKEVICQLRFPTILEIGSEPPALFQKKIRATYPLYEKGEAPLPKEIAEILAQFPIPKPSEGISHKFLTADSNRFISLASGFVALTDHKYQQWGQFRRELVLAQTSLEEVYQPTFYSRIGLRYRNVIDKEEIGLGNEPWDSLLNSPLIGLLGASNIGGHVRTIQTEASIKIDEDEVPGDLQPYGMALDPFPGRKPVYVIDVDLYTNERSSGNDVSLLDRFNRIVGNLFRWAISPKLHQALEPRAICPEE
jgi:uncharacterized protein (TIGR04255 family)